MPLWDLPSLFLLSVFCFRLALPPACGLGDGAKPPEHRHNLPVDAHHHLWQDGAGMNESERQFSFTPAALSTCERAKQQFLISPTADPFPERLAVFPLRRGDRCRWEPFHR